MANSGGQIAQITGRPAWRRLPAVTGAVLVALLCVLLVGGFQSGMLASLADHGGTVAMRYFDDAGLALLRGRLDAPCDSLALEAFVIDDKCYGYFGLTPSLLRIVLNGICLDCIGHWARLMMVAGGLLSFAGCLLIARRALADRLGAGTHDAAATGFALVMVFGGTLPFIVSNSYIYHEAILWAGSFAVLALWAAGRYVDTGSRSAFWLCLAFTLLTLHARVTVGFATAAAVMVWFAAPLAGNGAFGRLLFSPQARARPRGWAWGGVLLVLACSATPLVINQLKFGQITPPFATQRWYAAFPERLALLQGGSFRLVNLRCSAALYLWPGNIALTDSYPWIGPGQPLHWFAGHPLPDAASDCADSYVESMDPSFALIYGATAPVLLALVGLAAMLGRPPLLRRWAPPLAAGGIAALAAMAYSSVTYRYEHDFFPLLVVAGALGWAELMALRGRNRALALVGVVGCVLAALAVNFVAAQISGSPQPDMMAMATAVADLFDAVPPHP
jgi:hypothetical protein